jgi:hypothetical protein
MKSDLPVSRQGAQSFEADDLFSMYLSAEPRVKVTVTGPTYSVGRTCTTTSSCSCVVIDVAAE